MECEQCGQVSDVYGGESQWDQRGHAAAIHSLYQCERCGNRQRER